MRGFDSKVISRVASSLSRGAAAAAIATTLGVPAATWAAGVQVLRTLPYAEGTEVRAAVKRDCQVAEQLPEQLAARSQAVELVDAFSGGRRLDMELTEVRGGGGGMFSGPKRVEVTGRLLERGKTLGSFRALRYSMGGFFGVFMGTCGIFDRTSKAVADDIAAFLDEPSMDALLGDAQ